MRKLLIFIIILINKYCCGNELQHEFFRDTVDYERTRMFIDIPNISEGKSGYIEDDEGFSRYYLLPSESGKICAIIIDYSVMNRNYLIDTEDFDIELWNTFNKNSVGSRCFKKNNLYYRIDRFEDGLEVFCMDVDAKLMDLVNKTFRSIYKKPRNNSRDN